MSAAGPAIRLVRCGKTFPDGTRGVQALDLEIAAGETVAFLGPSGAGKTTALRLIAGLETPDPGGRVFLGDRDVTALPVERRDVGLVVQSPALFPNMTVADNVGYGLKVRRVEDGERRRRVERVLETMRIGDLRHRPVDQLSGGQKQRVALARALVVEPRVLLLDEPLAGLDARLREALRLDIEALLRRLGMTAVYVTHEQGEALALADRVVVMSDGRVAQVGSPRAIYFTPANRFVAEFVGTMNAVKGVLQDRWIDVPGGRIGWPVRGQGFIEVLFRPESVSVCEPGAGPLKGRVAAAMFLGDRTRLVVEGIGTGPLIVDTSPKHDLLPGDAVYLKVDPHALHYFEPGQDFL